MMRFGYQFRVLDEIDGVADDAGDEDLSRGEFQVAPDFEFMFVTDVAGFDQLLVSSIDPLRVPACGTCNP